MLVPELSLKYYVCTMFSSWASSFDFAKYSTSSPNLQLFYGLPLLIPLYSLILTMKVVKTEVSTSLSLAQTFSP
jgi:hypothetical protein